MTLYQIEVQPVIFEFSETERVRLSCGDSKKVLSGDFGDFYQRGESDCNSDVSSADE